MTETRESFRQRRRRRTYKINPRTAVAVQTIRRYADENGLAALILYCLAAIASFTARSVRAFFSLRFWAVVGIATVRQISPNRISLLVFMIL